jgi:hypothetical protein
MQRNHLDNHSSAIATQIRKAVSIGTEMARAIQTPIGLRI